MRRIMRMRRIARREFDTLLGEATTDTRGQTWYVTASGRTGSNARTKATWKKHRKKASCKHVVKPLIERLLAHMELMLLTCMEEVADINQEEEWRDAECPALVKLFINKRGEFARWMVDAANREEAVEVIKRMWDKR